MPDDEPSGPASASPNDQPTEIFRQAQPDIVPPVVPPGTAGPTVPPTPPTRDNRALIITVSIIGGVLLIALAILLTILLTRGAGTPAPSPTPSESASPSPSPTPSEEPSPSATPSTPPAASGPAISSFISTNSEVVCNTSAPSPSPQFIGFSWVATNVDQVYFGVDTDDASQAFLFDNLPPSGNTSNFPEGYDPFEYSCPSASQKYTLTVVGSDGTAVSKSVTITNVGDTQ
jgi:hypothetical protein